MVAVLAGAIVQCVVSEAWLPDASVRSNDAALTDRDVRPDVDAWVDDARRVN